MLTYIVIAFGLVVVLQLNGISRQLEILKEEFQWTKDRSFAHRLKERLEETAKDIKDIAEELQWHENSTFAHELSRWLRKIPEDIVKELQWHQNFTFAGQLREWLQEISKDITGELQTTGKDISKTLANIENNTSRE
jgi:hypothetical protein